MKTIIIAFMLLAVTQSNAQIVSNSGTPVFKDTQKTNKLFSVGKADLSHSTGMVYYSPNYSNDTIRTIMMVADTSRFYSLTVNQDGKKMYLFDSSGVYSVGMLGFRIAGKTWMEMLPNHRIIERMEYLDRFKRPLPTSLVVLSFTDTK